MWQKPAPRAEDGRALRVPLLLPFPFQEKGGHTHTHTNACEGKFNMFRNTGRGNILGVRKALPALTASRRSKPSRISHYKVNRLPASATLWHRRSISVSLPMDCTSGLGILAADGPVTQDDDPGPSSSCKVTPGPANDVWYLVILGNFSFHPDPRWEKLSLQPLRLRPNGSPWIVTK